MSVTAVRFGNWWKMHLQHTAISISIQKNETVSFWLWLYLSESESAPDLWTFNFLPPVLESWFSVCKFSSFSPVTSESNFSNSLILCLWPPFNFFFFFWNFEPTQILDRHPAAGCPRYRPRSTSNSFDLPLERVPCLWAGHRQGPTAAGRCDDGG